VCILAALLLVAPRGSEAQDGFTSPLIIPAAAFEASGVQSLGTRDRFSETYGYIYSGTSDYTCVMAPVYLPNGAQITRFEAAVADLVSYNPSGTGCSRWYPDVEVELMSTHMDDNIGAQDTNIVTHASVTSTLNTGQKHVVADTTIDTPWVNNLQQVYWVRVYVCSQFQNFYGVRIHYKE
jgi:hypothetical protein